LDNFMRILLVGGGTGGPVRPLLVVAQELKKRHAKAEFLLVGTKNGPEAQMANYAGIPFASIPAGKWRRYASVENFLTPFNVIAGFFRAVSILKTFKPQCVFGAGGFVQGPVVWAAWLLHIPVVIHQQDVLPGLANRLSQWFASAITVTFEYSIRDFSQGFGFFLKRQKTEKVHWTGNPFAMEWKNKTREEGLRKFGLDPELPTLLVTGGGTGAEGLNEIVHAAVPELTKYLQILHATGKGKNKYKPQDRYFPVEFISNMDDAYAAADVVIARAGLGTITELSQLGKVSIIVPMPNSHQAFNGQVLARSGAAIVQSQAALTPEILSIGIRKLLFDAELQKTLRKNIQKVIPSNAADKIATIIIKLAETRKSGN
jgi:UDP-N-acetylglucosamine--N-acetylmuramyl-(pentapeptide) pyrophosphoryl-undecaprenol N-acetylglucosamine transferase